MGYAPNLDMSRDRSPFRYLGDDVPRASLHCDYCQSLTQSLKGCENCGAPRRRTAAPRPPDVQSVQVPPIRYGPAKPCPVDYGDNFSMTSSWFGVEGQ